MTLVRKKIDHDYVFWDVGIRIKPLDHRQQGCVVEQTAIPVRLTVDGGHWEAWRETPACRYMVLRDFCLAVIKDLDPAGSDVRRADAQVNSTVVELLKIDAFPQKAFQRVCAVETGPKWGRKVLQAHAKEAGVPEMGHAFLPSIREVVRTHMSYICFMK